MRLPSADFVPGRVLILIGSLGGGGAERQAAYTAAGLARRFPGRTVIGRCYGGGAADFYKPQVDAAGVASCVISFAAPEYEASDIVEIRNRLAERYLHLNALSIFQMIFHHALLIREVRPEVVHTWLDYSNTLGGVAADLVGVPRLVMSGRSVAPDNFGFFQPYMKPAYSAILARRDAVLLNNSAAGANDYARWLGLASDRFRVIPNGFDLPRCASGSRAKMREALSIPQAAVVVGGLMRFREEKRPLLWIEMARLLQSAHPHLRFVIFGDGALLPACHALVEAEGLAGAIFLPGEASDAWAALSAMDIFVLTSRVEGLPNVMIEAQLVGVPVVCTGSGGMYETFVEGETGFGVREETAKALADAVGKLVSDPSLRRSMGARARDFAKETFGIERMIDQTIDAYRAATDNGADTGSDWPPMPVQGLIRLGGSVRDRDDCFAADLPVASRFQRFGPMGG